jgi:myo-inositol-1(or 4)-monophosphatase
MQPQGTHRVQPATSCPDLTLRVVSSRNHAAFSPYQRHGQGRAPRRPQSQARPRRGGKSSGVAEGAGEFRHVGRQACRGNAARGPHQGADKSHTWIVDPLDGTTNFLHGIPHFAISIGLQREGAIIAGLIYNPANDDLYIAERGKGAFLNDQRLRVAGRRRLNECVIACGLPHIGRGDHNLSRLEMTEIQNKVAGLRRFGAASLDMAFVAAGRLDGYWERNLQAWDMAAGQIIIREAGGTVSGFEGDDDPLKTGHLICGNEFVHAELVKILKPLGK